MLVYFSFSAQTCGVFFPPFSVLGGVGGGVPQRFFLQKDYILHAVLKPER